MQKEKAQKGGVAGRQGRKLTVAGYRFGTLPLVQLRILPPGNGRAQDIEMTIPQARETLRLLTAAIDAAENLSCADRMPSLAPDDRASPGEDSGSDGENHHSI